VQEVRKDWLAVEKTANKINTLFASYYQPARRNSGRLFVLGALWGGFFQKNAGFTANSQNVLSLDPC
jgi:hypothetical protein